MKGHRLLANKSHLQQITPEDLVCLVPVYMAGKPAWICRMEILNLLQKQIGEIKTEHNQ